MPPALSDLIVQLLAKNRDERPASRQAVADALRDIEREQEQTVLLASRPLTEKAPRPPRRKRLLAVAAVVLLAGILVLGAVITLRTRHGTLVVNVTEPDVQVLVDGEEKLVVDSKKVGRVELIPGEHKLTVKRGAEELYTESFALKSGGEVVIDAQWTPKARPAAPPNPPPGEADEAWLKTVAALPSPYKQVAAVGVRLKERNPGFDGTVTWKIEDGVATELSFYTDKVTDIVAGAGVSGPPSSLDSWQWRLECEEGQGSRSVAIEGHEIGEPGLQQHAGGGFVAAEGHEADEPVLWNTRVTDLSPLKDMKLTVLYCCNTAVADLSPLKDMKLTTLHCWNTRVSDLSPLKDMKLTVLSCYMTRVSDLSPLKDMKLLQLSCGNSGVTDLSPLKNMELTRLDCNGTRVSDLSPLKNMQLTRLDCGGTSVSDLSPLKGMPLKELRCDFKPARDTEILRSLKTLETINDQPAAEFWKGVDAGPKQRVDEAWLKSVAAMKAEEQVKAVAARLKELNPGFDGTVTPKIEGGVVTELQFHTDKVTNISPVRALMGLRVLYCNGVGRKVELADLSPLKDLKLTELWLNDTKVSDLSPLKDMKLTHLGLLARRSPTCRR